MIYQNWLVKMGIRPKITLRGFKPGARGAAHVLGELETIVMELLWCEPELSVSQVEEQLRRRREIAHTTVLTTLDRMYRKGYLTREKRGKPLSTRPDTPVKSLSMGSRRKC